jgi:hypothetical protein
VVLFDAVPVLTPDNALSLVTAMWQATHNRLPASLGLLIVATGEERSVQLGVASPHPGLEHQASRLVLAQLGTAARDGRLLLQRCRIAHETAVWHAVPRPRHHLEVVNWSFGYQRFDHLQTLYHVLSALRGSRIGGVAVALLPYTEVTCRVSVTPFALGEDAEGTVEAIADAYAITEVDIRRPFPWWRRRALAAAFAGRVWWRGSVLLHPNRVEHLWHPPYAPPASRASA